MSASVQYIEAAELVKNLRSKDLAFDYSLMDVRSAAEFAKNRIANSQHVSLEEMISDPVLVDIFADGLLGSNKPSNIVIYCKDGKEQGPIFARMLQSALYKLLSEDTGMFMPRVFVLRGGIVEFHEQCRQSLASFLFVTVYMH